MRKIAFSLWFFSWALYGAGQGLVFNRLSIEQGLSQNSANCLFQDSKGFIWIGTEAGLNRYDGFNFVVFKPREMDLNSLSNNYVYSILEDRRGEIWIGTDEGLNRFDRFRGSFTRYLNKKNDETSISGNRIYCLHEDRSGNIWIGTEAGLNLYLRDRDSFRHFQADPENSRALSHNDIRCIREDGNGKLWLATFGGGINAFDPQRQEFIRYRHNPGDAFSLSGNQALSVLPDSKGFIWIGTTAGLNRFHPSSGRFKAYRHRPDDPSSLSDDQVNCLLEDDEGGIWLGTNDGGLDRFDPKTEKFFSYRYNPLDNRSLCADRIISLYRDRSGIFWVGSYGGGLCRFRLEQSKFSQFHSNPQDPTSLGHNYVRSFCVDSSGRLWVGTDSQGMDLFHRETATFTHFRNDPRDPSSLSNNRVFSIIEDLSKNLWIGTNGGGLNRYIPTTGKFVRFRHNPADPESISDDRIRSMSLSKSGFIWIGTDGGGINKFDPRTGRSIRYLHYRDNPNSLSYDRIFGIYADPVDDVIWVGTFGGGLNNFDPTTERFVRYQHEPGKPDSLSNNYLMPIMRGGDGLIYVGSNGGGLSQLDPRTGVFRNYTEDDGMPNNTVYGILEDDTGNLWMSTNRGIVRFNPKTKKFKTYDVNDGLQSNEFNGGSYFKSSLGLMYFGGINGFNEFDPKTIRDNPHIPPIVITDFQLMNKSVPIGPMPNGRTVLDRSISETTDIWLTYQDSTISFDFAALSFVSPEKNLYAYMMEGFDREWNYSGKRHFASYTNLPPKSYTFRVKGSNNDGVWNEQGVAIRIHIAPPFWKTWWFITASSLFVLLSAYGWYARRIRILQKQKAELERLVTLRTQELHDLSLKDPLTGLRNRRFIQEVLAKEIHSFIKKKTYLLGHNEDRRKKEDHLVYGVMMIDIDHFKTINDKYGHDMGDKWLVGFSNIMRRFTRADDELIRFGGEEFLVILKNTDPNCMEQVALKLKRELSKIDEVMNNLDLKRTCSIGYAQFPFYASDPELLTFDDVVKIADLGLYYAKQKGRDQVVRIIPEEHQAPDGEAVKEMIASLNFGVDKGFYTIKPSR